MVHAYTREALLGIFFWAIFPCSDRKGARLGRLSFLQGEGVKIRRFLVVDHYRALYVFLRGGRRGSVDFCSVQRDF